MSHLPELLALLQVMLIDLSMAGDNALVVGMAAAGLPPARRKRAIVAGIFGATLLRIVFAFFAVRILHITGLLTAGGLLLLWVGWKMYRELRGAHATANHTETSSPRKRGSHLFVPGPKENGMPACAGMTNENLMSQHTKSLPTAVGQIIAADVSMSLDNVLGVAGVAREHYWVLAAGLTLSVVLMGVASSFVARLAARHGWIAYLGLVVILYTAVKMIAEGMNIFL